MQSFIDFIDDAEKIVIGAYSPLDGFADSTTLESIVQRNRVPNGLVWTIPIILALSDNDAKTNKDIKEG